MERGRCIMLRCHLAPRCRSTFLERRFVKPRGIVVVVSIVKSMTVVVVPSVHLKGEVGGRVRPMLSTVKRVGSRGLRCRASYSNVGRFSSYLSTVSSVQSTLQRSLRGR